MTPWEMRAKMSGMKIENPKLTAVNPHFKNRYAPLDEVLRVVNEGLPKDHRIEQTTGIADGILMFVSRLYKGDTVVREAVFPFPTTSKAQELGSALTYCRRYGLLLLFNLVGEEDDDGNAAQGNTKPAPKKSKPAKKAAPKKPTATQQAMADNAVVTDDEYGF